MSVIARAVSGEFKHNLLWPIVACDVYFTVLWWICPAQTDFRFLFYRQHKLDESLAYQQFSANVGEEESWINEKNTLVGSDDYGDTLAAVQVRQLSHLICFIRFEACLRSSDAILFSTLNSENRTFSPKQKWIAVTESVFLFY